MKSVQPEHRHRFHLLTALAILASVFPAAAQQGHTVESSPIQELLLEPCRVAGSAEEFRCGTYEVYENRETRVGRRIPLRVIVLPARSESPSPDPLFFVFGGPGQTATNYAGAISGLKHREDRDIVLVDQRGTSEALRLDCKLPGSDDNLQGYFAPLFDRATMRACREALEPRADLRLYTTATAADDLDEIRAALGYERINLMGGSYGTRAILVYLQRHPQHVRTAVLQAVVPFPLRNPLYHARAAQDALELLFADCERDPDCAATFPSLSTEFATVLERLAREPARAVVAHPVSGDSIEVELSREQFAEALQAMMYHTQKTRELPLLIHHAFQGDFSPFAQAGLVRNRALRRALRMGMLMSVVCSEDVPRIAPEEIERETRGTFLGDTRVREQIAACEEWPRGNLPADHGEPVRADVPVLLISGSHDPVTPPKWGEEAARHLPNGLHVVVPSSHDISSPCVEAIQREFLREASAEAIDTVCVQQIRLPRFQTTRAEGESKTP